MSSLPIVLVPGFNDKAAVLRALARALRKAGLDPHPISPQPSTGVAPIESLAEQLAAEIENRFGPDQPLHLFGFSMGGLITRYYLQRLDGLARTRKYVTLATPHNGSWMAYAFPKRPGMRQMRPGSEFLQDLNRDVAVLGQLEFTSIWTLTDLSIVPPNSSRLPVGRMIPMVSPFHGTLLYDPLVLRRVASCFIRRSDVVASGE